MKKLCFVLAAMLVSMNVWAEELAPPEFAKLVGALSEHAATEDSPEYECRESYMLPNGWRASLVWQNCAGENGHGMDIDTQQAVLDTVKDTKLHYATIGWLFFGFPMDTAERLAQAIAADQPGYGQAHRCVYHLEALGTYTSRFNYRLNLLQEQCPSLYRYMNTTWGPFPQVTSDWKGENT